jgi:class 3 adenylate cyclase
MFTDIVGSTTSMAKLGDRRWREVLSSHDELIRRELVRFSGTELDTSNDGFLAKFERPRDGLLCACAISDQEREIGIDVRIGLHADEPAPRFGDLDFVFLATDSRVASLAGAGEVLVTSSMAAMLSEPSIQLESRGMHVLEGLPGEHELFEASWHGAPRPDKAPFASVTTTVSDPRVRPTRSVLTLMFTDILGATPTASRLGPEAWRQISKDHDALIERQVSRANGRIVDAAGDRFSRPSSCRPKHSHVPSHSGMGFDRWGSPSGSGSTLERWRIWVTRWAAWRSMSAHASSHLQGRMRSWCLPR